MHPKTFFFFSTTASYVVLLAIAMAASPLVPHTAERRRRRVEQAPTSADQARLHVYNVDMVGHSHAECAERLQQFRELVNNHNEAVSLMQNKYKDFKLLFDDTLTREFMFSSMMLRGDTMQLIEGTRVKFYEAVSHGNYHRTRYFDEIENGRVFPKGHRLNVLPREYNSDVYIRTAPRPPGEHPINAFEKLIANRWLAVIHAHIEDNDAGFPYCIYARVLIAPGNSPDEGSFSNEVLVDDFNSNNQNTFRSTFLYRRVQLDLNACGIRLFYDPEEDRLNEVRDQDAEANGTDPINNIQLYLSTVGKIIRFPANAAVNPVNN